MSWRARYTKGARDDLLRLYAAQLEYDIATAERALAAIDRAVELLEQFPFACRKADPDNALLRELLVTFGSAGYVLLYEIEADDVVTILAARHQRENDYR